MVLEKTHRLILKNDDENSYLLVIAALVRFCDHGKEQAEQCAIIAHNNGKCDIMSGNYIEMLEIQSGLTDIGLDVEIEEYESSMY
jgi:ATP-dependent Clp protease adaptor protein ClpS